MTTHHKSHVNERYNTLSRKGDGQPDTTAYLIIGVLAAAIGFLGVVATIG